MREKTYFMLIAIVLWFVSGAIAIKCTRGDIEQAGRVSELDRQYSEQDRATRELLGRIGESLGTVREGCSSISGSLKLDATDLRSIAVGVRQVAEEVKGMEDELDSIASAIGEFYYDWLDQQIADELGIEVPR